MPPTPSIPWEGDRYPYRISREGGVGGLYSLGITKLLHLQSRLVLLLPWPMERFWSQVKKTDDCWLWTGRCLRGYGQLSMGSRKAGIKGTHRVSWELHHGPIPKGLSVLHKCDNPACVRPDHLFLGTQQDNLQDMRNKKRNRTALGEKTGNVTLTAEVVLEIRRLHALGVVPKAIAAQFSIERSLVYQVVNRVNWKHI